MLFSCIKEDLLSTLSISAKQKYINYHAPCQLCGNDQRLRSGLNFRLPTVWDAPCSVYEISIVLTGDMSIISNNKG